MHDYGLRLNISQRNWIDVKSKFREKLYLTYYVGDHRQEMSENEQLQWRITLLMYKSLLFVPKFSNLSFIEARLDHIYSYLKSPKTFMNPISNKLLTNISLLETRRVLNTNIYSNRSIVINETHSIENRPSEMYRSSLKTQPQN